ncbi:MAG: glycoside hydrolase family 5 protein [Cyclobacteriaceae bacterium]|nr:glycoside hydrolase family 5 protein [Cyclobacteriaceae bacterium]
MKKTFNILWLGLLSMYCQPPTPIDSRQTSFVSVRGSEILDPNGNPVVLRGTNLGNWLHPEGYMFKFQKTSSAHLIDDAIRQMVGPGKATEFWDLFLENYVTAADIHFLKSIGVNHLRVPFNYLMLSGDTYLGATDRGYRYLDRVIEWCRQEGIWVVLDMHAAPGGQTGDNIDDSFGYPFLFTDSTSQAQTVALWGEIAKRYRDDPTVIGYDLLNEPIAHYFSADFEKLNPELEKLYRRIVSAIRESDNNHLVFLGGAQWNTNFKVFGAPFDDKAVYTFHKYWMPPEVEQIQEYLDFRDRYQVPIYMGESGENTDEWVAQFRQLLDDQGVHWCFWPYKKMDNTRGVMNFYRPEGYDKIIDFAEGDRASYAAIRQAQPDPDSAFAILRQFAENSGFEHCYPNTGYIDALGFEVKAN